MPTLGYTDSDGIDVGNKYVTKEYMIDQYPNLVPQMKQPGLWVWGTTNSGSSGAMGDNTVIAKSSPVTTAGGGTNWASITANGGFGITAGTGGIAGIKTDGTLWMWGGDTYGQLGNGLGVVSNGDRSSPITVVGGGTTWKQICPGGQSTVAVKTDGTLWTWGDNYIGQLGIGAATPPARSSPGTTAGGGTNWKQASCVSRFGGTTTITFSGMMAAVKTDGTLWAWGDGTGGGQGTGTTVTRLSPGTTAGGGTNWVQVSACLAGCTTGGFVVGLKSNGSIWAWGVNGGGQLGDGTTINKSSPISVLGGSSWTQVSAAGTGNNNSVSGGVAALKNDGTLWLWGSSGVAGATANQVAVSSPISIIGGGTNWIQISASANGGAGIKSDGTLWNWAGNTNAPMGDGTTINKSSPVTMAGAGTNWKTVSMGSLVACALEEAGGW